MYQLVKKLRDLVPYEPISGEYKIRLDANESFIRLSPSTLSDELCNIELGRYPDPYAVKTVEAFAKLYGVNKDIVTAGNGSDELISIITASFLEKGDRVLCFSPDFSMYSFYPYINELDVLVLEKDEDFHIDFKNTVNFIKDNNIKCVMFSNPCNPTSIGFKADDIRKMIRECSDTLVVVDEAYMEFYDENESLLSETEEYDNLIVLKTCSKALALAGIRLGFAVANTVLTKALRAAKSPYNVNVITQEIGAVVLGDKDKVHMNISAVKKSVESFYKALKEKKYPFFERIYETNTNFVFIKTKEAKDIFDFLLKNGIAVRQLGEYLRITCGTENENSELVLAMDNYKGSVL